MGAKKRKAKQVRGSALVEKVIEAALEELSAKGFEGLSIEEVAERAGVNKTTIYRRWPTKADLARAALERTADAFSSTSDTGSVRGDLISFLKGFRDFATSARGQTLMRMMLADGVDMRMSRLAKSVKEAKECIPRELVARAVLRSELPRGTDAQLVFDTLVGTVQHHVLFLGGTFDDRKIAQLVDLVLMGVQRKPAPPKKKRSARSK